MPRKSPLIRKPATHTPPDIAAPAVPPAQPKTPPKPVKTRQAEYVARRRLAGFRRVSFYIHEVDFGAGFNLGLAGKNLPGGQEVDDVLSYMLGWTDGLIARARRTQGVIAPRLFPTVKET
jgi:hypothetical protein